MREVRSTLERLFMSPLTIPVLTGIAVLSLLLSTLNVVLRPGEGDAERQLAVRGVYDQMRPEFERYAAAVDSIDNPRNCKEGQ